eukprot:CAMPEP_0177733750 /NCGR_PEP_ID=MMETSP0484_2-20121128/23855_1 /TAXON_ID=354590 /ORGANISM="Rhodomonas lens, Strain RHODO" /LENGTH=103 /DNA_ID=CAMNT_0019247159 /DNA_START=200 /DNA_END=507 /DNA_ORIENTATION=+
MQLPSPEAPHRLGVDLHYAEVQVPQLQLEEGVLEDGGDAVFLTLLPQTQQLRHSAQQLLPPPRRRLRLDDQRLRAGQDLLVHLRAALVFVVSLDDKVDLELEA